MKWEPHIVRLVDPALALVVCAHALVSVFGGSPGALVYPHPVMYPTIAVVGVALWRRQRIPFGALLVVVAAQLVVIVVSADHATFLAPAVLALFTAARYGDRRTRLPVIIAIAVGITVVTALADSDAFWSELGEGAKLLLPIAVGDAVRSRSDRLRSMIDSEADMRVQAERIRIARDLHDVVAHGLSIISIQSGVAAHLLDDDPRLAREALEIINATGKTSLEDLRAMVGVLRSTDEAPLGPTPSDPNDITELVAAAQNAGLTVTLNTTGRFPDAIGDAQVVAVHRIIQEALTNVARHAGPTEATIGVIHSQDHVSLEVENSSGAVGSTDTASTGVGIIGMTERAESVGGSLQAYQTDTGGFIVETTIPYELSSE